MLKRLERNKNCLPNKRQSRSVWTAKQKRKKNALKKNERERLQKRKPKPKKNAGLRRLTLSNSRKRASTLPRKKLLRKRRLTK